MFYKVIYDDKVIDVLNELVYLKYQTKYDRMIFCEDKDAQAIFSSDRKHIWHVEGFYYIPTSGYDTVRLEEIDEYEYNQLKAFNGKTIEEVIDGFVELMLNNENELFVDSLKRLYADGRVNESKVIELYNSGDITIDQKERVLGN